MKTLFTIYFILLAFGLYGYVENILKLIHACAVAGDSSVTLMIVLRVIGVLTGALGAVLGYF